MRKAVVAGAAVGATPLAALTLAPDYSQPSAALVFGGAGAGLSALVGLVVRVLGRGSNVYKAPRGKP